MAVLIEESVTIEVVERPAPTKVGKKDGLSTEQVRILLAGVMSGVLGIIIGTFCLAHPFAAEDWVTVLATAPLALAATAIYAFWFSALFFGFPEE